VVDGPHPGPRPEGEDEQAIAGRWGVGSPDAILAAEEFAK
jgi:hypothetical protein